MGSAKFYALLWVAFVPVATLVSVLALEWGIVTSLIVWSITWGGIVIYDVLSDRSATLRR